MSVALPELTEPPAAAVISTLPAGGPRPAPGTAAGSVGASAALVNEVVASVGGGVARSELLSGVLLTLSPVEPVAPAVTVAPATLGESVEPAVKLAPAVDPWTGAATCGAEVDRPLTDSEPAALPDCDTVAVVLVVETDSPVSVVVAGATTVVVTAVTVAGATVCTVVELTVSVVTSLELITVAEPPAEIERDGASAPVANEPGAVCVPRVAGSDEPP